MAMQVSLRNPRTGIGKFKDLEINARGTPMGTPIPLFTYFTQRGRSESRNRLSGEGPQCVCQVRHSFHFTDHGPLVLTFSHGRSSNSSSSSRVSNRLGSFAGSFFKSYLILCVALSLSRSLLHTQCTDRFDLFCGEINADR